MPRRTRAGRGRPRGQGGLQASRALKSVATCAVAHETRAAFPPPTRTRGHGGLAHSHARTCWSGTCANARAARMPGRARGVCTLVTHLLPGKPPPADSAPRVDKRGVRGRGLFLPIQNAPGSCTATPALDAPSPTATVHPSPPPGRKSAKAKLSEHLLL